MFVGSADLHKRYWIDILRVQNFLRSQGRDDSDYWIGPEGAQLADARSPAVRVAYSTARYEDTGPLAVMSVPMRGRLVELQSRLGIAVQMMAWLLSSPARLAEAAAVDPSLTVDQAINLLLPDDADLLKPDVRAYASGDHLAPNGQGWRWYLVETYGEIVPVMDCALPAPLVFALHAMRRSEAENLSGSLAKFTPPDAAAILAQ